MVHRLTLCDYLLAGELRALFDPEYIDGSLDQDFRTDLQAVGQSGPLHRLAEPLGEDLKVFDAYLLEHHGPLLSDDNDQPLRAVRIAFHTNAAGLKRHVLRALATEQPSDKAIAQIGTRIGQAIDDAQTYNRWLVALRMHHTLAKIAIDEYTELIEALYAPCRRGDRCAS